MTTHTATATSDDRRMDDLTTEETVMGNLHLSDLAAASWGVSWEPDARMDQAWLDGEDDHPPDKAPETRPIFERLDPYCEDVRRLRRLLVGS